MTIDYSFYEEWQSLCCTASDAQLSGLLQHLNDEYHTLLDTYIAEHFWPDVLAAVLDKDPNDDWIAFLETSVCYACDLLDHTMDKGFLEIFSRVIDRNARVYADAEFGSVNLEDIPDNEEVYRYFAEFDDDFVYLPHHEYSFVSPVFVRVLGKLVQVGGMEKICKRLRDLKNDAVVTFYYYVSFTSQIFYFMRQEKVDGYAKFFIEAYMNLHSTFTEETLRTIDKKVLDEILKLIASSTTYASAEIRNFVYEKCEAIVLKQCLSFVLFTQLEKQLAGIKDLRNFVKAVSIKESLLKKSKTTGSSYEQCLNAYENENKTVVDDFDPAIVRNTCVTKDHLILWLANNKMIEKLLNIDNHLQVIMKSVEILIFVSENNFLEKSHIDLLWNHTQAKHASDVGGIFDTLYRLCFSFSFDLMEYLFQKLASIPNLSHSEASIKLLSSFNLVFVNKNSAFVKNALRNPSDIDLSSNSLIKNHFGLKMMWNVMHEEALRNSNLVNFTMQRILHSLKSVAKDFIMIYIDYSIINLQNISSVTITLKFLVGVLNIFPTLLSDENSFEFTKAQLISNLEKKHGIFAVMLRIAESYVIVHFLLNCLSYSLL
jgi:hypothetical protein